MATHHIPCGTIRVCGLASTWRGAERRVAVAVRPAGPGEMQIFEAEWACRASSFTSVRPPVPERGHDVCRAPPCSCARPRGGRHARAPRRRHLYRCHFRRRRLQPGLLEAADTRVIGIDRDRTAIAGGFDLVDQSDGRLTLFEDRFSNLAEVCAAQGIDAVDGVVMDVGVSSMQIDQAERGFSFRLDGPLDMRMGRDGPTAADVVARASEADLANIIYIFGEERHSRAVARAIVAARKEAPIATTRRWPRSSLRWCGPSPAKFIRRRGRFRRAYLRQ